MSPRKLLLLTAVVFVLFAFIFLFERKMPTTSERQSKGELHWDLPVDRVVSIRLEKPGSVVELAREGENWRLIKPLRYPADSSAASDLAQNLAQLKRVGGDSSEARPEDYGLTKPSAKATLFWKDPEDPKKTDARTLEFGIDIPGTEIAAARVAGQARVLFVPTSVSAAVKKNASDFESRDVFGGSAADFARIELERGRGRLVLSQRDGAWRLDQPLTDLAAGDATSRLAGDLTALRVIDFLSPDKEGLATFGLSPPLFRVTVSDTKGKTITVEFGATRSDGNSVYGRRDGQVFTVSSTIAEDLSKEAEAFREPKLLRFDRGKVESLDGSFGGDRFRFVRGKDGGWSAGGKLVIASSIEDLFTALLDLKSRAFLDEREARALSERSPEASIEMALSGGEQWKVSIYGGAGGAEATVSRRPGAFRLSGDPTSSLTAAFRKAAGAAAPAPTPGTKKK